MCITWNADRFSSPSSQQFNLWHTMQTAKRLLLVSQCDCISFLFIYICVYIRLCMLIFLSAWHRLRLFGALQKLYKNSKLNVNANIAIHTYMYRSHTIHREFGPTRRFIIHITHTLMCFGFVAANNCNWCYCAEFVRWYTWAFS